MSVYDRQIANAQVKIKAKGQKCTWRKVVPPANDNPANPSAGTETDYTVYIAFFPNIQIRFGASSSMLRDTEVPSGKFYGLMGAVPFEPEEGDTVLTSKGKVYGIIDKDGINELAPNGDTILYQIRFTK